MVLVVTIDDDLQNPPEEIHKLLAKLHDGHDVVYGSPQNETHGFLPNQASRVTKLALQGTMGVESASKVSAFRVFRTRLRNAFEAYRSPSFNNDVLLTWGTTSFSSVNVRQDDRLIGDSGYSLKKPINHAINMMTGFSVLPLQIASLLGITFGALGMLVLTYVVGRYFIAGSAVPGFTFICLHRRHLLGRAALCPGHLRRVPGAHALPLLWMADSRFGKTTPIGDGRRPFPRGAKRKEARESSRFATRAEAVHSHGLNAHSSPCWTAASRKFA